MATTPVKRWGFLIKKRWGVPLFWGIVVVVAVYVAYHATQDYGLGGGLFVFLFFLVGAYFLGHLVDFIANGPES